MFERLKQLYQERRVDAQGLQAAVEKGWLTQSQVGEITAPTAEDAAQ